jgi:hypothetical protein
MDEVQLPSDQYNNNCMGQKKVKMDGKEWKAEDCP